MPELVLSTGIVDRGARPLLSLATATYSRALELSALLRSHGNQVPAHTADIEIVICDNASMDGTEAVVRAFAEGSALRVRYFRQRENVGVDRNIFDALSLSEGQFVWFLADDDEIAPGMLSFVVEALRGLDSEIMLARCSDVAEWDVVAPTVGKEVAWIDPGDPRWAPRLFATSFLASVVFQREALAEALPRMRPLIGSCYAAWGLTLTLLSRAARVPYIDDVCVLGNANFNGKARFANYAVMIDGRITTWDFAAHGRVRDAMRPLLVRHARQGLRGAAAASLLVASRGELLARYASTFRVFGPRMITSLPWVVIGVTLPPSIRRALDRLRQFVRRGGRSDVSFA